MSTLNHGATLLLRTTEGLLLQLGHAPRFTFDRWTATLNLRPSREYRAVGIKTGREVARTWSEQPPHMLHPDDASDDNDDISVFLGKCMFSVPKQEAAKLSAWVASLTEQVPA